MDRITRLKVVGSVCFGIALLAGCSSTPAPQPAPPPAPEPEPQTYVEQLSADGLFAFARATLSASGEGRAALDALVTKLTEEGRGIAGVEIVGHSDRIGGDAANQTLSNRRANAVRDYFVSRGLSADVITASGRGSAEPLVECPSERGQALIACLAPNRRVEVQVNYAD